MKTDTIVKLKNLKDKYLNKYTVAVLCVVAAVLVVWGIFSVVGYYRIPADNPANNEIANSGFSVECGERIIASLCPLVSEGNVPERVDAGIISTNKNGTDMKVISTDCASGMNYDGNYIYYINNSDGGNIYRIKPDGTEREKLFEAKVFSMIYDDNYLYIYRIDNFNLSKVNVSSLEETVLVKNHGATTLTMAGDKVYFFYSDGTKRKLASVSKNGGKVKCYQENANAYGLVAHKGYLYYIDSDENALRRSKIGSTRSKKVGGENIYRFFIKDDTIYYLASFSAQDGGAYQMDMNGKNEKKICNGSMRTLSVAYNNILSISVGYKSEPFLYFVDIPNGVIVECYEMIDEQKIIEELYPGTNKTEE